MLGVIRLERGVSCRMHCYGWWVPVLGLQTQLGCAFLFGFLPFALAILILLHICTMPMSYKLRLVSNRHVSLDCWDLHAFFESRVSVWISLDVARHMTMRCDVLNLKSVF